MAGDWIKMRMDLALDPAVLGIGHKLRCEVDTVVGKLHRFWSWASSATADGRLPDTSIEMIDQIVDLPGFAEALMAARWLARGKKRGLVIPRFGRHMNWSAKARCGEAVRKAKQRNTLPRGECPDQSGTRARAARSREEQKKNSLHAPREEREKSGETKPSHPEAELRQQQHAVVRELMSLAIGGEPVFTTKAASSIAKHAQATVMQVAWVRERLAKELGKGRAPQNPPGWVRSLIENEDPPGAWVEKYRRQELANFAEANRRQHTLASLTTNTPHAKPAEQRSSAG